MAVPGELPGLYVRASLRKRLSGPGSDWVMPCRTVPRTQARRASYKVAREGMVCQKMICRQVGVDACDTLNGDGAVAQWIERRFPKCAVVLTLTLLDGSSVTGTNVTKAQSLPDGETRRGQ